MPDTLVGTDSHTTMINGLGVLGRGVGGIEAEAVTLGQPYYMLVPEVIGFKLTGALREGVTATDLVLTVTQMLRSHGVVGKFVEFYGEGQALATRQGHHREHVPRVRGDVHVLPRRHGDAPLPGGTGRDEELVELVEAYSKEQGLWRTDETPEPRFSETLDLDLGSVEASLAGPRRPQDRVALDEMQPSFRQALAEMVDPDHPLLGTAARTPTTVPTRNPSPRAIFRTLTYPPAVAPTRPKARRAAPSSPVRATPQTTPSLSPRATPRRRFWREQ